MRRPSRRPSARPSPIPTLPGATPPSALRRVGPDGTNGGLTRFAVDSNQPGDSHAHRHHRSRRRRRPQRRSLRQEGRRHVVDDHHDHRTADSSAMGSTGTAGTAHDRWCHGVGRRQQRRGGSTPSSGATDAGSGTTSAGGSSGTSMSAGSTRRRRRRGRRRRRRGLASEQCRAARARRRHRTATDRLSRVTTKAAVQAAAFFVRVSRPSPCEKGRGSHRGPSFVPVVARGP